MHMNWIKMQQYNFAFILPNFACWFTSSVLDNIR